MSTRSNIAIRVKSSDYEKVSNVIGVEVNDNTPYIQIYSHNDGYPSHMLDELESYFDNYDDALEMILEGCTSGIYSGESRAYKYQGESYEDNAPWPLEHPTLDECYLYTFEDNKWNVKGH